jgi:hypothetical protein
MQAAPTTYAFFFALAACLCCSQPLSAQANPGQNSNQSSKIQDSNSSSSALPEAPQPPAAASTLATQSASPFTLHNRFVLEAKTAFGPGAFIFPAGEALITMADPPNHYPREWSDGGGAFARNYGAEFVRHTTAGLTHFAFAAALREDPRYHSSTSTNIAARTFHALAFTLVDRSDSGRHTVAFSNLAGSAAGGFIGMAFLPDGFNDTTHAYQRAAVEVTNFASHNVIAEFSPELAALAHKLHLPGWIANSFLPADRKQP